MTNGPVPSFIYDVLKLSPLLDPKILDEAEHTIKTIGYLIEAIRPPIMRLLSQSSIDCLKEALSQFGDMAFNELTRRSHEEPAFRATSINAAMDFELMIDEETEDRDELISYMRETAATVVL